MSPRTEGEIYYNQIEGHDDDSSDEDQIEGLEYDSSDGDYAIDEEIAEIAEMEKEIAEMEKEMAETNERTTKLEEISSLQNKLTRIWKEIWEMTFVLEKRNLKIPDGCKDMINEANKLDSQASHISKDRYELPHLVIIDHFERAIKLFQEALCKLERAFQLLEDEYMKGWIGHLEWVNEHIKEVEEDIEMSKARLISLQGNQELHMKVILEIEQWGYKERSQYLDRCRANLKQEEANFQKEQNAKLGEGC